MTLRNLSWEFPLQGIFTQYLLFPPFQSSATGPACPVGGGEVGVDLAKLKNLYPRGGGRGDVLVSPLCREMTGLSLGLTTTDRYNGVNGLGGEERSNQPRVPPGYTGLPGPQCLVSTILT